jgi:hypothetical protein
MRKLFADAKRLHNRLAAPAAQQAGAAVEQLQRMRAAFHVNMMRAYPDRTHAEIAAEIDKACGIASPYDKATTASASDGAQRFDWTPTGMSLEENGFYTVYSAQSPSREQDV